MQAFADLIPPADGPLTIVELGCGEGLLAEVLLKRFPNATLHGLDGSSVMLEKAGDRLAHYGDRFLPHIFRLEDESWRRLPWNAGAVVSSLVIHHLDDAGKERLYADIFAMLAPGGVLLIADLIQPAGPLGQEVAAKAWDNVVGENVAAAGQGSAPLDFWRREGWNTFRYPDEMDRPSRLFDQLHWLEQAGFVEVDVYWLRAGHALFGGRKPAPAES
jgi:tRNA (cmo5U34)-methyltransferase